MSAWNKGKKMPHTKEWEEKRLTSVRESAKNRIYAKGYKRSKEHTQPMLDALKKNMEENPEKYREIAINNLPKDVSGEKNGNWKGGITEETRGIRSTSEYKKWREDVLARDEQKCKLCSSGDNLQVHHIIAISELPSAALVPMNGVTLCAECHYENDEAWQGKRYEKFIGKFLMFIKTIPHKLQAYDTCGNWSFTSDGTVLVFVSKLDNSDMEALIGIHEVTEALLCKKRGIEEKDVTKFDERYELARKDYPEIIGESEPGDHIKAPYHKEHEFATRLEHSLSMELAVDWQEYNKKVNEL